MLLINALRPPVDQHQGPSGLYPSMCPLPPGHNISSSCQQCPVQRGSDCSSTLHHCLAQSVILHHCLQTEERDAGSDYGWASLMAFPAVCHIHSLLVPRGWQDIRPCNPGMSYRDPKPQHHAGPYLILEPKLCQLKGVQVENQRTVLWTVQGDT